MGESTTSVDGAELEATLKGSDHRASVPATAGPRVSRRSSGYSADEINALVAAGTASLTRNR